MPTDDIPPLARLEVELAAKTEEIRILRQVSADVNSTLNLEEIYDIVLRTMADLFGFQHAMILLADEASQTLRVVASRGYDDPSIGIEAPFGSGVVGIVAQRRQPMRVGNLRSQRSYAAAVRKQMALAGRGPELERLPSLPGLPDAESQIAIPLLIKDRLVGVFAVESAVSRTFNDRDETLTTIVGNLSASAIHNALAYRREEEYAQALEAKVEERTHQIAEKNLQLQDALLKLQTTHEQLVMREKLASLGNLVAGVAHEMNTPLGALSANNDTVRRLVSRAADLLAVEGESTLAGGAAALPQLLENMAALSKQSRAALDRISHVVTSLRVFARLDRSAEDVVDIREGLEVAATLLESQVKDRITIRRDYGEIPPVLCHPGELNQVFMNLLLNASQSIEGTGEIHVRTRFRSGGVLVEIADTGAGISPDNLHRIFDPGFTTKGVRVGTGLGLATARRIVEEHGGEVSVESEPGAGATFRVYIPLRSAGE